MRESDRSVELVRWEVNGLYLGQLPICDQDLRSARRWSKRLTMTELKLASAYMNRRGADYGRFWGRVPPLGWVEDELRYWMPALARECHPY